MSSNDKPLNLLYASFEGVNTPNDPTFTTPLAPTTKPLGDTNIARPFANAPFPSTEFSIPFIVT